MSEYQAACQHHYIVPTQHDVPGEIMLGVCKKCGFEKAFPKDLEGAHFNRQTLSPETMHDKAIKGGIAKAKGNKPSAAAS